MPKTFRITYNKGFGTDIYVIETQLSPEDFARELAKIGFQRGRQWIMPGAILSFEEMR